MDSRFSVKDKGIVITGGAGVLGTALAKALAQAGARICVADLDLQGAQAVCQAIEADGGSADHRTRRTAGGHRDPGPGGHPH